MKIDYVMPYVDCNDPEWQKLFKANQTYNKHDKKETELRFADNKTFRYVFRGIEKHMPWINNVILLVQSESQVPRWINRKTVRIVTHDQFIPKEFLPTFNSCTIECFLHNIPGLAPFFVYGNDDMYILNDCVISDFFNNDMMPLGTLRLQRYNPDKAVFHQKLCRNITEVACKGLNLDMPYRGYYVPKHGQNAFSTSIFASIYNEFETDIRKSISKFREEKNLSQYFFMVYYMLSTGHMFETDISFRRFDIVTDFKPLMSFM